MPIVFYARCVLALGAWLGAPFCRDAAAAGAAAASGGTTSSSKRTAEASKPQRPRSKQQQQQRPPRVPVRTGSAETDGIDADAEDDEEYYYWLQQQHEQQQQQQHQHRSQAPRRPSPLSVPQRRRFPPASAAAAAAAAAPRRPCSAGGSPFASHEGELMPDDLPSPLRRWWAGAPGAAASLGSPTMAAAAQATHAARPSSAFAGCGFVGPSGGMRHASPSPALVHGAARGCYEDDYCEPYSCGGAAPPPHHMNASIGGGSGLSPPRTPCFGGRAAARRDAMRSSWGESSSGAGSCVAPVHAHLHAHNAMLHVHNPMHSSGGSGLLSARAYEQQRLHAGPLHSSVGGGAAHAPGLSRPRSSTRMGPSPLCGPSPPLADPAAFNRLHADRSAVLLNAQAALRAAQISLEAERVRSEEEAAHNSVAIATLQQQLDLVTAHRSLDAQSAEVSARLQALEDAWQGVMDEEATSAAQQRQLAREAAAVRAARAELAQQEAGVARREAAAVDAMRMTVAAVMQQLDEIDSGVGDGPVARNESVNRSRDGSLTSSCSAEEQLQLQLSQRQQLEQRRRQQREWDQRQWEAGQQQLLAAVEARRSAALLKAEGASLLSPAAAAAAAGAPGRYSLSGALEQSSLSGGLCADDDCSPLRGSNDTEAVLSDGGSINAIEQQQPPHAEDDEIATEPSSEGGSCSEAGEVDLVAAVAAAVLELEQLEGAAAGSGSARQNARDAGQQPGGRTLQPFLGQELKWWPPSPLARVDDESDRSARSSDVTPREDDAPNDAPAASN